MSEHGSSELGRGGDFGPDPPPDRDPEQGRKSQPAGTSTQQMVSPLTVLG